MLPKVLLCSPESETSLSPRTGVLSGESFLIEITVLSHARQHSIELICPVDGARKGTQFPRLPSHTDVPRD